jgi:hypothetical protein
MSAEPGTQVHTASVSEPLFRTLLVLFGAIAFGTGLWLAASPGTFYDVIAPFAPRSDHFMRDIATFELALGLAFFMAVSRPSWRAPVLFFGAVQATAHAINHLVDISDTDPGWLGPFNFIAIAISAAVLWWLFSVAWRAPSAT